MYRHATPRFQAELVPQRKAKARRRRVSGCIPRSTRIAMALNFHRIGPIRFDVLRDCRNFRFFSL